ncbi:MAG TPA: DUF6143 family protein [Caproiciproducens sp.]|jgi:hypothetical protein|nr:DUF6143 family protein [Caproiciproducens sp.]
MYESRNDYYGDDRRPDYRKMVNIPLELYESMKGDYFIGYADNLTFGKGKSAWARLYNPRNSGRLLHVNVWTVTDISVAPFRAQFWFNAEAPGRYTESELVTPSNTAIRPLPEPRIKLQEASDVSGEPTGGVKAFVRRGQPESTLVETENGKLIFPPGGNFLVFLSLAENPELSASGRIAFGWYEEKI